MSSKKSKAKKAKPQIKVVGKAPKEPKQTKKEALDAALARRKAATKATTPAKAPAPALKAKRKKVAKPAATATVNTIAVEPITRDGVVNEARTMRVYLIYFRRYIGNIATADTPEWARLGIERLNTAIDAIDGVPGLESYEFVGPLVESEREYGERKAITFAAGLAKLIKALIARIAKATDRAQSYEFCDIAEGKIAAASLAMERFADADEPIAPDTEATPPSESDHAHAPVETKNA